MDYLADLLDWGKALGTVTTVLVGVIAWFFFSVALMGCTSTPLDPNEQDYALPPICATNDSTVKVFDKTYKIGSTKRATVYIDQDGALWLRWPDGTQKSYDEGQIYFCNDNVSLWDAQNFKGEE